MHPEHPANEISAEIVRSSPDSSCMQADAAHLSYANWCLTALPCVEQLTPPSANGAFNVGCRRHGNKPIMEMGNACRPVRTNKSGWSADIWAERDGGTCREIDQGRYRPR